MKSNFWLVKQQYLLKAMDIQHHPGMELRGDLIFKN
jgi:hypothetical protein